MRYRQVIRRLGPKIPDDVGYGPRPRIPKHEWHRRAPDEIRAGRLDGVQWQPLVRDKLYKRGKPGNHRIYGSWEVPDEPVVPHKLRGASVEIRHDSPAEDVANGRYREQALRPVPPADPDFDRLYGLREDVESWHNYFKRKVPEPSCPQRR